MGLDFNQVIILFLTLLGLDVLILSSLMMVKNQARSKWKIKNGIKQAILKSISLNDFTDLALEFSSHPLGVIKQLQLTKDTVSLPSSWQKKFLSITEIDKIRNYLIKRLHSFIPVRRMEASSFLTLFNEEEVHSALRGRLFLEKRYYIKIAILHSLIELEDSKVLDLVVSTLPGCPEWYRNKVYLILEQLGDALGTWAVRQIVSTDNREIQGIVLHTASVIQDVRLQEHAFSMLDSEDSLLFSLALKAAEKLYPLFLAREDYIFHPKLEVREMAIISQSFIDSFESMDIILACLEQEDLHKAARTALTLFLQRNPRYIHPLLHRAFEEESITVKEGVYSALAHKMPYFLSSIKSEEQRQIEELLIYEVKQGNVAEIIDFLNKNRNPGLEEYIIDLLKPLVKENEVLRKEGGMYLNENFLESLGLSRPDPRAGKPKIPLSKWDKVYLTFMLFLVLLVPVLLFFYVNRYQLGEADARQLIRNYLISFDYYFAYYAMTLNTVYLVLLMFSGINLIKQSSYWSLENYKFLFSPHILPSVSIMAPAYNEEKTIVDSIYSLLNNRFPDYEVVVINDGSKDNTIGVLIDHFNLERVDSTVIPVLEANPVRGLYRNSQMPNLLVVDKENGGKADALNAGINYAQKEYVCSIDADSLLEPDSLLKIMYQTVTSDREMVACGGNIVPINGCKVDRGELTEIHLGSNMVARFQTIEYLRSFISGRLGWAYLNSLLIISGAFGVFKRQRVLEIGGYMTGEGIYKQDTVGEDMELVVRLIRHMKEINEPMSVDYSYNANCWTEVPEDRTSLYKQRDRWNRGLIEITTFHKKMFMNFKYGTTGLISIPYFFIFELYGPFFELFGYIFLFLSILLGMVNGTVALFMFTAIVMYGILISVSSLLLSERDVLYFKKKEVFIIIFMAFIENFGYRQILSIQRSVSYVSFLIQKNKGWQKLERKGFGGGDKK